MTLSHNMNMLSRLFVTSDLEVVISITCNYGTKSHRLEFKRQ
jgi:hypothetical protein